MFSSTADLYDPVSTVFEACRWEAASIGRDWK